MGRVEVLWGDKWGEASDSLLPPLPLAQESTPQLAGVLVQALRGEGPPSLGPFSRASPEEMQALEHLRGQLRTQWKMLQVAGEARGQGSGWMLGVLGTPCFELCGERGSGPHGEWGAVATAHGGAS